jgi:hypothetical protein
MTKDCGIPLILLLLAALGALLFGSYRISRDIKRTAHIEVVPAFKRRIIAYLGADRAQEAHKCVYSLLRGWLWLLAAPVLGPMERLWLIREQQAQGMRVSVANAGLSLLRAFLLSIVFWIALVFLPILTLTFLVARSFS